jgi:hypothetical protein
VVAVAFKGLDPLPQGGLFRSHGILSGWVQPVYPLSLA